MDYAYVLRERDGSIRTEHERHIEGLFSRAVWLRVMEEAGFTPRIAARKVPSRYTRGDQAAIQRAVDMAGSCTFRPVTAPTTTTIQFAFN